MWLWLVIAVLAGVGEVLTTGLFLAIIAVAAVITALVALVLPFTLPFALVETAIFAGMSLGGIVVIRPVLIRSFGMDSLSHGAGHVTQPQIVGRRATVTRTVDAASGQVRIGDGEFWTARSYDPDDLIPIGASVEVIVVDGLTALVSPIVPLTLEDDSQFAVQDDAQFSNTKGA